MRSPKYPTEVKSKRAIRIMTSLSLGVVFVASLSWLGLGQVSGQISRINVFGSLSDRPEKTSRALNYLVVGSDSREGLTPDEIRKLKVGSTAVAAGGRSDTMFLVHISKSRDSAFIISLPRDTLVQVPAHISQDGTTDIPERPGKLNASFAFGGAPLLIQTIEAKTNLKIDHYVEVRELGTGKSRLEVLREAGLDVRVLPRLSVDDGIQAVRRLLPKCWFNMPQVKQGLDCLRNYRRDYDEKRNVFFDKPMHDWASHGSDSFRYLALGMEQNTTWSQPITVKTSWIV